MHPVAKRCLIWAIVLVGVGILTLAYGYELVLRFERQLGFNADPALHAVALAMQAVRSFALPLAAGLITATIVIQSLAPRPAVEAGD